MEKRNLRLDATVTAEQWDMLARTAQELAQVEGFDWKPDACDEIEVYMRAEDAPGAWRDWVAGGGDYGAQPIRVATFLWNSGEPFARNELELLPVSPNVLPQDVERMQRDYEQWVHNAWQRLRRASGMTYIEAGHVEQV